MRAGFSESMHRRRALNIREREWIGDPRKNAMRGGSSRAVIGYVRMLYCSGVVGPLADKELLDRFLERRDEMGEEAFAELVRRHGPMVLGACLRLLRDAHEAEDAFQATF